MESAVATALSVTPAQATRAWSSMSPEQACSPVPPPEGCKPASTSALPVSTEHAISDSSTAPAALSTMRGGVGVLAVALLERRLQRSELVGVHGVSPP